MAFASPRKAGELPSWAAVLLSLALLLSTSLYLSRHLTISPGQPTTQRQQRQQQQSAASLTTWRLAAAAAARPADAARLSAAVEALVAAPLPPRQPNLSPDAPLVYIHQRKAGGSTLRRALVQAAHSAAPEPLPSFSPCKGGVRCDLFSLEGARPAALYAGHFSWGELRHLDRRQVWAPADGGGNSSSGGGSSSGSSSSSGGNAAARGGVGLSGLGAGGSWRREPRASVSCVTNFKEPVARIESCFYYRRMLMLQAQAQAGRQPPADGPGGEADRFACLSNLTEAEMRRELTAGKHNCLNEPLRMLSGQGDPLEWEAGAGWPSLPAGSGPQLPPTQLAAVELALAHLAHCIPVVMEEPASLALVRHWFPQLAPGLPGDGDALERRNVAAGPRCQLTARAARVLAELAAAERLLYEAALRRARAMLAAVQAGALEAGGGEAGAA